MSGEKEFLSINLQEFMKSYSNPGFLIRQCESEPVLKLLLPYAYSGPVGPSWLRTILLEPGILNPKQLTDLLHVACRVKPAQPDFIEMLVTAGAVIDLPRLYGGRSRTPFYVCMEISNVAGAARLLSLGATIQWDRDDLSCLDLALREKSHDCLKLLLQHSPPADVALANPFMAVGHGDVSIVKMLHDAGMDFGVSTEATGLSPLQFVITLCAKFETGAFVITNDEYRAKLDIVRYLIQNCGQEITEDTLLSAMERRAFLTLAFVYLIHLRHQRLLIWPKDLPSLADSLPYANTDVLKQVICRARSSCENSGKILEWIFEATHGKTGRVTSTLFELAADKIRSTLAKSGECLNEAVARTDIPVSVQKKLCLQDLEYRLEMELASYVFYSQPGAS